MMIVKKIEEIENNIWRVTLGGTRELIVIGTAHVSRVSVEQVQRMITTTSATSEPVPVEKIFLELDAKRLEAFESNRFKNINIRDILRTGQGYFFTAYLLLSIFQRKIAEKTGSEPGGEFKVAIRLAREKKIELELIDRAADITLKRAWRSLSVWQQIRFLMGGWSLSLPGEVDAADSSAEFIESLKNRDKIAEMMEALEKPFPALKRVIIDERDHYMAEKVWQTLARSGAPFRGIVVIGAGHVAGMLAYWKSRGEEATTKKITDKLAKKNTHSIQSGAADEKASDFLAQLEETPKPKRFWRILKFVLPILVVSLFIWGFVIADWAMLRQAFIAWVISNGVFAALGALIARAHPLTVLTALVASPITSLNPTIGAGFVAAWVEAYVRPPLVKDMETMHLQLTSLPLWWKNQFTKILLVFIFVSCGSALGAWVALPFLLRVFV